MTQAKGRALASYIDQTLLKPEALPAQIKDLCQEARDQSFFGVCVNSSYVPLVSKLLKGSPVSVVSVVGFPLGAMATESKAFETSWCVDHGADEIDMVLAIGKLKAGDLDYVRQDIRTVVEAAKGKPVKVIIETSLLSTEEKRMACKLAVEAGAHFVKTSTGFNGGGATVDDIKLMREVVGPALGVKASGGVKTAEQAWNLIHAGATRIGTSSGTALCQGAKAGDGY